MAPDPVATTTGDAAFVSLYRRYRPGTFDALRGQDHVVRALRTAVIDEHVAHAYLFSGPRGTGKTSSARILAKALNCEHLVDGEPCGVCSSCIEITRGTSMDVIELDAASNNGVDAMRDLIGHAALGSPGRHKVYIIDEVHMLSNAAANALLKTLEEPPSHVVYILATTDPQKVPATIRSRTQHLEFRLLGAATIEQLLRDVRDDAHLDLDDDALSIAVRKGRGSARDALSALDQVAASGESTDLRPAFIDVIEGIADDDARRSLLALNMLAGSGWGPQQLAMELVEDLRQGFLLTMSPEVAEVVGAERQRLSAQADRIGLARLVRSIELLGQAQIDMREAPDPQVVLEVAVVRAARADLGGGVAELEGRIGRLERRLAELEARPSAPTVPVPAPPPPTADGSSPSLGAWRSQPGAAPATASEQPTEPAPAAVVLEPITEVPSAIGSDPVLEPDLESALEPEPAEPMVLEREPAVAPSPESAPSPGGQLSLAMIRSLWADSILGELAGRNKALFRTGELVRLEGSTLHIGVSTEPQLEQCRPGIPAVERALLQTLGQAISVELSITGRGGTPEPALEAPAPEIPALPDEAEMDEVGDVSTLPEAHQVTTASLAASKILKAFPGATEETS